LSPLSLIFLLIASAGVTIALIFVLHKKRADENREMFLKNSLILKTSEIFQKELEGLIKKEMEKNVAEIREKNIKILKAMVSDYKNKFENSGKEIESAVTAAYRDLASESEKIKNHIGLFVEQTQKEMTQVYKTGLEARNQLSKEAQGYISEMVGEAKKTVSIISKSNEDARNLLMDQVRKSANEMGQNASKEISLIYRSVEEMLKNRIIESEKQIEDYKNEKLRELDENIYKIINEVAKNTIGKTIDLSTHEELVTKSLRQAKRDGLFGV